MNYDNVVLTPEEQAYEDAFEAGDYKTVANFEEVKKQLQTARFIAIKTKNHEQPLTPNSIDYENLPKHIQQVYDRLNDEDTSDFVSLGG